MRLPVIEAYQRVAGPVLMLAAEHGLSERVQRQQELAALEGLVGAEVKWFPTGHWISAADHEGVIATVEEFVSRIGPTATTHP